MGTPIRDNTRRFFMPVVMTMIVMAACSKQKTPLEALVAESRPSGTKILLVGIDGATFSVIDPLIKAGELPTMRRLIDNGARGTLESDPPMSSPAIWTTVVTGAKRDVHGIKGFLRDTTTDGQKDLLVNSNDRVVTALWNWLGPFGKTSGFVGWWVSWPAEPVNGWIISDRIVRSRWGEWYDGQKDTHLTFPPGLIDDVYPLTVDPEQPPMNEIAALADFTTEELEEFKAATKPILFHGMSVFKFAYCAQRSNEKFALHLLKGEQPDVTGVFLIAVDPVSHTFWHFYEPDKYDGVDTREAERLGRLIPNLYRHNDDYLSQLLEAVDSTTVVIIVSDHGFESTGELPKMIDKSEFDALQAEAMQKGTVAVGQSGDHHADGVLIASGGPIRKGVGVNATVFDIAPTMLALLGLPVPTTMPGRVLKEMIEPAFLERYPVQYRRSYDHYMDRQKMVVTESVAEEEIMQRLRSLGYVK